MFPLPIRNYDSIRRHIFSIRSTLCAVSCSVLPTDLVSRLSMIYVVSIQWYTFIHPVTLLPFVWFSIANILRNLYVVLYKYKLYVIKDFLHFLNECVNRIHLKFIEENWGGVKKKKENRWRKSLCSEFQVVEACGYCKNSRVNIIRGL